MQTTNPKASDDLVDAIHAFADQHDIDLNSTTKQEVNIGRGTVVVKRLSDETLLVGHALPDPELDRGFYEVKLGFDTTWRVTSAVQMPHDRSQPFNDHEVAQLETKLAAILHREL